MRAIEEAAAAFLQAQTGIRTVCGRTPARGVYPLLAVSAEERSTVLVDGGRQAERTLEVTVTAAADREREGNSALLSDLVPLLLGGFPMETAEGRRVLRPLGIRTGEDRLRFTLELCRSLTGPGHGDEAAPPMETLHFGV